MCSSRWASPSRSFGSLPLPTSRSSEAAALSVVESETNTTRSPLPNTRAPYVRWSDSLERIPADAVGTHINKPNNTQRQERQGRMRLHLTPKRQCPADFGVPRVLAINRHHSQFPARAIPTANPNINNAIAPSSTRPAPGRCIRPANSRAPYPNVKKRENLLWSHLPHTLTFPYH